MELEKLPAFFSPAEAKMLMKANVTLWLATVAQIQQAGEDPGSSRWNPVKLEQGPVHAVSATLEFDTNRPSLRWRCPLIIPVKGLGHTCFLKIGKVTFGTEVSGTSPFLQDANSLHPFISLFEPLEEEILAAFSGPVTDWFSRTRLCCSAVKDSNNF